MKNKTLCNIVAGLFLLASSSCTSGDNGRELKGNITVPAYCRTVFNFGYNPTVNKYFVSCQNEDQTYSFYSRNPGTATWKETKFGEGTLKLPSGCQDIYNFGYNYSASRYFVSCQTKNGEFYFYTKNPSDSDWKEVKFISDGKILQGVKR